MVFSVTKIINLISQPHEKLTLFVASHKHFDALNEMLSLSFLSHEQSAERSGKTPRIQPNE